LVGGPDSEPVLANAESTPCEVTIVDETTINVRAPMTAVMKLLPEPVPEPVPESAEAGSAAASDAGVLPPLCGFFSLAVDLSIQGRPVPPTPGRPLRIVVCKGGPNSLPPSAAAAASSTGGEPPPQAAFMSSAGCELSFFLSRPNAPAGTCLDTASHMPSDAPTWLPPVLALGGLLSGLKSAGGHDESAGGDGSGSGSSSYSVLVHDSTGHTHALKASLTRGGLLRARYLPYGLALSQGVLKTSIVVDGHAKNAMPATPIAGARMMAYSPEALTVSAVSSTAKKVCAGADMKADVAGLADLVTACAAVPIPEQVLMRVRVEGAADGEAALLPAVLSADGASVSFVCPDLIGSIAVELSLSGGQEHSFTAPVSFVALKK
jgi:hypothetical protein